MADSEEVALYRAILADPHDDTARLVFADWLQENGDATHAEFIRVQCRLARASAWSDGYTADRVRNWRLLREPGTKWCRAPGAPAAADTYPTGFFVPSRGLAGGATAFLDPIPEERAREWFSCRPIASARLYFDPSMGDRLWLLTTDVLPALRTLWLELGRFCPADLVPVIYRTLARDTARSALTRLELNGPVPLHGLSALVTSATLERLEVLSLTGSDFGDEHASVLARRMSLPALRELTLARDFTTAPELTPVGAEALGRAEWLTRLTAIRLWGCAGLGKNGVEALFGRRSFPELRALDVRNCPDAHSAVGELVGGRDLPGLRELALSGDWTVAGWSALTGGPQELQSLALSGSVKVGRATKNFFARPALRNLRRLEMTGADLGPLAVSRLSQAPLTESLRWLAFKAADGTNPLSELLAGRAWPNLEYLHIDNALPAGALLALLESGKFPRLVGLKARIATGVDRFVAELAKCPAAARLRELDISGLVLTPVTAALLADAPDLGDIDRLCVSDRGSATRADFRRLTERFGARLEVV